MLVRKRFVKFSVCIQQCCNESPRDPVTSRVQCPIMSKQLSSEALLESCHFSYWTLVESMKIATRVDLSPSQDSLQDWYSVEIYIQSGINYLLLPLLIFKLDFVVKTW